MYMYKENLALNNLPGLICQKSTNQSTNNYQSVSNLVYVTLSD